MPRSETYRTSQRAPKACLQCAKRRVKCDKRIPCRTCTERGTESSCAREVVRVQGRLTSANPSAEGVKPTYSELEHENERLKAVLEKSKSKSQGRILLPSRSSPRPASRRPFSISEIYENRINLPHDDETVHHQTVCCRSDVYMPSREASDALLKHGFVWTAWIHFAVHEGTFLSEHEAAWEQPDFLDGDPSWLAIYFGFIAMSLLFMTDDEAKAAHLPNETTSTLTRNWYDAATHFLNSSNYHRTYTLRTVQAIAILLGLGKSMGDYNSQPLLQTTGIRIGQIIGMDREPPLTSVSDDPIVREISRRTWWTLVICEWLSVPVRKPCVHEGDFEVNLPLLLTDEELSLLSRAQDQDQIQALEHGIGQGQGQISMSMSRPGLKPKPVQYHLAMIAIAKSVYRFQYQLWRLEENDANSLEKIVLAADEDLASIISALPAHLAEAPDPAAAAAAAPSEPLQTDENETANPPWVSLQWRSLTLTLLTYRMRVNGVLQYRWPRTRSGSGSGSGSDPHGLDKYTHTRLDRPKAICIESAVTIITLVNQYKGALARHRPWAMTFYVFSAAMTLAIEARDLADCETKGYMDDIRLCFEFLEFLSEHNALAERAIGVLREFLDGGTASQVGKDE